MDDSLDVEALVQCVVEGIRDGPCAIDISLWLGLYGLWSLVSEVGWYVILMVVCLWASSASAAGKGVWSSLWL